MFKVVNTCIVWVFWSFAIFGIVAGAGYGLCQGVRLLAESDRRDRIDPLHHKARAEGYAVGVNGIHGICPYEKVGAGRTPDPAAFWIAGYPEGASEYKHRSKP